MTLEQFAQKPYTFYHLGQKFVLKWVIADDDSDLQDNFELESNGDALSQLVYLAPNFKLIEEDPTFFDAMVQINGKFVSHGFEWRAATLSHKITEAVDDSEVTSFDFKMIKHSSEVTSEALSVFTGLKKPNTGFEKILLGFCSLENQVSETVAD